MMRRGRAAGGAVFLVLLVGYLQPWVWLWDPQNPRPLPLLTHEPSPPPLQKRRVAVVDPAVEAAALRLSVEVQRDLELTQRGVSLNLQVRGCGLPKLICGAPVECSLPCQIHYVMTCLMLAQLTNRTLWMNWEKWPYKETQWEDLFQPVGIRECLIDNDTASVLWARAAIDLSYPEMTTYPHSKGLPVPRKMGKQLKKLPVSHFPWWMGQFARFAMKLQLAEEELMKKLRTAVKFNLPTVGILVRKRDKLSDKRKSTQAIDKYMTGARRYFTKLEELLPSVTRRVFIATDDRNVVKLVRKRYRPPKWEILGIQLKTEAEDLLKDIYLLSECDYVICSFASDMCRLVLELKESRALNSSDRVRSLDHKYFYSLPAFKKLQYT